MATGATDTCPGMRRAFKVRVRTGVATQASGIHLLGCEFAHLHNLGHVSTGLHVGLSGPVAALAGKACAAVHQGQRRVRIVRKFSGDVAMAESAALITGKAIVRGACLLGCRVQLIRGRRLGNYRNPASARQNQNCDYMELKFHVQSP